MRQRCTVGLSLSSLLAGFSAAGFSAAGLLPAAGGGVGAACGAGGRVPCTGVPGCAELGGEGGDALCGCVAGGALGGIGMPGLAGGAARGTSARFGTAVCGPPWSEREPDVEGREPGCAGAAVAPQVSCE